MKEEYYFAKFFFTLFTINNGAGKYGLADADGRVVVSPEWEELDSWGAMYDYDNYIKVFRDGKYGLLAYDGTELIPPVMDEIRDYVFIPVRK